ncbi:MAG: hypothetical protein GWQ05_29430 [Verrucomicrobiaceae bacterium]|nr:hypothetical protein [Verrucomicrobiaceae bacterium]NCF95049.1 hypothetical protein [Verrucomicrobiaceae bacterium]
MACSFVKESDCISCNKRSKAFRRSIGSGDLIEVSTNSLISSLVRGRRVGRVCGPVDVVLEGNEGSDGIAPSTVSEDATVDSSVEAAALTLATFSSGVTELIEIAPVGGFPAASLTRVSTDLKNDPVKKAAQVNSNQ